MISRTTWIVLALFIIALAAAIYLQNTPAPTGTMLTPSPTSYPKLINEVFSNNFVNIAINDAKGSIFAIERKDNQWIFTDTPDLPVDQGKVQELLDELTSANIFTSLDPKTNLVDLGLDSPAYTINLKMSGGNSFSILIGNKTPVENGGYYAQVNQNPPVVINSGTGEAILNLVKKEALIQPTPTVIVSPTENIQQTPIANPTGTP